jgi:hypothetical protein
LKLKAKLESNLWYYSFQALKPWALSIRVYFQPAPPHLARQPRDALAAPAHLGVAAQLKFESKNWKQYITLHFQELSSRRFQLGFHGVDLHRPTLDASTTSSRRTLPFLSQLPMWKGAS